MNSLFEPANRRVNPILRISQVLDGPVRRMGDFNVKEQFSTSFTGSTAKHVTDRLCLASWKLYGSPNFDE